jgi:YHS domain-containing protein
MTITPPRLRRRAVLVLLAALAMAASPALAEKVNVDRDGIAIHGYDPVAYFTEGRPVEGRAEVTAEHGGAIYRFASAEHRDMFRADSERFAPRYGGFCAYGVAQGYTPDIDPNAWAVVDDRLYLNLNPAIQRRWQQDVPGYIEKADANWPRLR